MRTAVILALLLAVTTGTAAAQSACTPGDGAWVREACYDQPRMKGTYGHGILGGTPEWTRLRIELGPKGRAAPWAEGRQGLALVQGPDHIFEDVAPRVYQLDGAGPPEIVVVDTAYDAGARLLVLNLATGRAAATPHIGTRNRWLAPVGAADLDGDGKFELAYVDRPHLARVLKVWRYADEGLEHLGDFPGVTNHRIGEEDIAGGIRDCGDGPEMIVADAGWRRLMALRFDGRAFAAQDIGPHEGRAGFARAMACGD